MPEDDHPTQDKVRPEQSQEQVQDLADQGFAAFLEGETALAKRTTANYVTIIKGMLKVTGGKDSRRELNKYLKDRPFRSYAAALAHYQRFKGRAKALIKVREKPRKPHFIPTFEQFVAVIKSLGAEEQLIAMFLMNTGCRCHEAFKVKAGDIQADGSVTVETKGQKYRLIRLSPDFYGLLDRRIKEAGLLGNELVFWTNRGSTGRSKVMLFWQALNKKSKELVGKYIGTHDFRRYCAVYMRFELKYPLEVIKELLGHNSIKTTAKYTEYGITEERIKEAAVGLGALHRQLASSLSPSV